MVRTLRCVALTGLLALVLGARADASGSGSRPVLHDVVSFSQLGYYADPVFEGRDSAFSFDVPVTARLRRLTLRLAFRFAAQLSPLSTVSVLVGNVTLASRMVSVLRIDPRITVSVPFSTARRVVKIRIAADLLASDNPCRDVAANYLWAALRANSTIEATTWRGADRPFIGEFLDPYGGSTEIVIPKLLGERGRSQAVALAYELQRINRWRNRSVVVTDRPSAASFHIVVDSSATTWSTAGRVMHISEAVLPALLSQTEQLLSATDRSRAANVRNDRPIATQTVRGVGPLPIFDTMAFDALEVHPAKASLHLNLSHSVVPRNGVAFVDIYVDGRRASRRILHRPASREVFDVPLESGMFTARTHLAIVPTYYPGRVADCYGASTAMTFGIGPGSRLRWSDGSAHAMTVYDFLTSARGRLALLTTASLSPAVASKILSILGSVNDSVSSVDMRATGDGPRAEDDALMVFGALPASVADTSAASPIPPLLSVRQYDGKPALFVSSVGALGVSALAEAASYITNETASGLESTPADLTRVALSPLPEDETYAQHLRHNAGPSLAAFACVLTFMLFMSRRREPT